MDRPPRQLDAPLELDPTSWEPAELYHLLTALVVPRPIAWVSTVSAAGVRNLAPHSYFQLVGHEPPHVVFSSSGRKDTLDNVEATGEFVVNLTTMHVVEQMNATALDAPADVDEFDRVGIESAPSRIVTPDRVAHARAAFECRLREQVPLGSSTLLIGEIVHLVVSDAVWRDGRVRTELLDPVCRLSGRDYARLGERFSLDRPSWPVADGDGWVPRLER